MKIIVPQGETTRSLIPLEQKQLRISEIGSRENEVRGLSLKEDHTVTFLNFYRLPYLLHHIALKIMVLGFTASSP